MCKKIRRLIDKVSVDVLLKVCLIKTLHTFGENELIIS